MNNKYIYLGSVVYIYTHKVLCFEYYPQLNENIKFSLLQVIIYKYIFYL